MYIEGSCPDYGWFYSYKRAPTLYALREHLLHRTTHLPSLHPLRRKKEKKKEEEEEEEDSHRGSLSKQEKKEATHKEKHVVNRRDDREKEEEEKERVEEKRQLERSPREESDIQNLLCQYEEGESARNESPSVSLEERHRQCRKDEKDQEIQEEEEDRCACISSLLPYLSSHRRPGSSYDKHSSDILSFSSSSPLSRALYAAAVLPPVALRYLEEARHDVEGKDTTTRRRRVRGGEGDAEEETGSRERRRERKDERSGVENEEEKEEDEVKRRGEESFLSREKRISEEEKEFRKRKVEDVYDRDPKTKDSFASLHARLVHRGVGIDFSHRVLQARRLLSQLANSSSSSLISPFTSRHISARQNSSDGSPSSPRLDTKVIRVELETPGVSPRTSREEEINKEQRKNEENRKEGRNDEEKVMKESYPIERREEEKSLEFRCLSHQVLRATHFLEDLSSSSSFSSLPPTRHLSPSSSSCSPLGVCDINHSDGDTASSGGNRFREDRIGKREEDEEERQATLDEQDKRGEDETEGKDEDHGTVRRAGRRPEVYIHLKTKMFVETRREGEDERNGEDTMKKTDRIREEGSPLKIGNKYPESLFHYKDQDLSSYLSSAEARVLLDQDTPPSHWEIIRFRSKPSSSLPSSSLSSSSLSSPLSPRLSRVKHGDLHETLKDAGGIEEKRKEDKDEEEEEEGEQKIVEEREEIFSLDHRAARQSWAKPLSHTLPWLGSLERRQRGRRRRKLSHKREEQEKEEKEEKDHSLSLRSSSSSSSFLACVSPLKGQTPPRFLMREERSKRKKKKKKQKMENGTKHSSLSTDLTCSPSSSSSSPPNISHSSLSCSPSLSSPLLSSAFSSSSSSLRFTPPSSSYASKLFFTALASLSHSSSSSSFSFMASPQLSLLSLSHLSPHRLSYSSSSLFARNRPYEPSEVSWETSLSRYFSLNGLSLSRLSSEICGSCPSSLCELSIRDRMHSERTEDNFSLSSLLSSFSSSPSSSCCSLQCANPRCLSGPSSSSIASSFNSSSSFVKGRFKLSTRRSSRPLHTNKENPLTSSFFLSSPSTSSLSSLLHSSSSSTSACFSFHVPMQIAFFASSSSLSLSSSSSFSSSSLYSKLRMPVLPSPPSRLSPSISSSHPYRSSSSSFTRSLSFS
ncbi:hypothetical protein CSUI_003124, partial [Cystoisospora suis]